MFGQSGPRTFALDGRSGACTIVRMPHLETNTLEAPEQPETQRVLELARLDLQLLAEHVFRGEQPGHTLQPTALLGELWLRLLGNDRVAFESPAAFRAWAATAMRHILVDHARRKRTLKRGGGRSKQPLHDIESLRGFDLVELDDALELLTQKHPRSAQVIEMRFFGGMDTEMIADRLGVTARTVRADWSMARAWLHRTLRPDQT